MCKLIGDCAMHLRTQRAQYARCVWAPHSLRPGLGGKKLRRRKSIFAKRHEMMAMQQWNQRKTAALLDRCFSALLQEMCGLFCPNIWCVFSSAVVDVAALHNLMPDTKQREREWEREINPMRHITLESSVKLSCRRCCRRRHHRCDRKRSLNRHTYLWLFDCPIHLNSCTCYNTRAQIAVRVATPPISYHFGSCVWCALFSFPHDAVLQTHRFFVYDIFYCILYFQSRKY